MRKNILRLLTVTVLALQIEGGANVALADGTPIIGQIVLSSHASLRGVSLPGAGVLLENDALQTGTRGRALVDFPAGTRASLGERTRVQFRAGGGRLVADMHSGTVIAKGLARRALLIETPKYRVEPTGDGSAVYAVRVLDDRSVVVAANSGTVMIVDKRSGGRYALAEGKYASISAAAAAMPAAPGQEKEKSQQAPDKPSPPATAPPPPPPGWHIGEMSHGASVALVGALAAGGGAAAALPSLLGGDKSVSPVQ